MRNHPHRRDKRLFKIASISCALLVTLFFINNASFLPLQTVSRDKSIESERTHQDGIPTRDVMDMLWNENQFAILCRDASSTNNVSEECEEQVHRVPYIIRNGTLYISRAKLVMLIQQKGQITKRLAIFNDMLRQTLELARQEQIFEPFRQEIPFVLEKGDAVDCHEHPILTWSRKLDCPQTSWAIPSYHLWGEIALNSSDAWETKFAIWNSTYPWSSKIQKAIWRGSPTGNLAWPWRELPRVKLVYLTEKMPHLLDARLVKPRVGSEEEMAELVTTKMEQEQFMKYAAIVDVDGNSWSSRFGNLLCYNSVVLKVHPVSVDYFHSELEPWKHYIPINANMSNLREAAKYVFAQENTEEMKTMIQNANNWCKRKLLHEQLSRDFLSILLSYARGLEKYDKSWHTVWKSNEKAYKLQELEMDRLDTIMADKAIQRHAKRYRGSH